MNWGKGLVIGLAAFMLFITVLVVQMFRTAEDSIETDYYEKGLHYDVDYNQMQQVITDKAQPIVTQTNEFVNVKFVEVDSGAINFKRPSDSKKDQIFSFDKKEVQFPKSDFEKGEWKLIIRWTVGAKKYLSQTNLFMP